MSVSDIDVATFIGVPYVTQLPGPDYILFSSVLVETSSCWYSQVLTKLLPFSSV